MATFKEFMADVDKRSGVNRAELPLVRAVVWHPRKSALEVMLLTQASPNMSSSDQDDLLATLAPTVLELDKPCPPGLNPQLMVLGLFEGEDDWRMYAFPMSLGFPAARITLAKAARVYSVAEMPVEMFKDELAAELRQIAEDSFDDDDDDDDEPEVASNTAIEEPKAGAAQTTADVLDAVPVAEAVSSVAG